MKKRYCLILLILTCKVCTAQNLVPNGDFEIYVDCPYWYNDLDSLYAWTNPMTNVPFVSGTPDFFHDCGNFPVGMPSNYQGYQWAHSKWAYVGIYLEDNIGTNSNHREYLQTNLISPLIGGVTYLFKMYVNLSNKCRFSTHEIGVVFNESLLSGINNQDPLLYLPDVNNVPTNNFDTLSWTLVSGFYTATGGESFIVIGNFKNDLQTETILYNNASPIDYIYCYIDDVSLTPLSTTTVNELNASQSIAIFPNPATDQINFITTKDWINPVIKVYDIASHE